MSNVARIFVVEGDEGLNRNLVNTLRKDGYQVQGVVNGTDAVRVLWSEEYDVVICDLKTPGADGFELLQWLRAYRPNTRMILLGSPGLDTMHTQALENGAASYLEKPLDLRMLKEELRRLVQQTGFSADLDSFDLLDVIQIITMSRKSIALLVNTGLEEQGILRFQNGELVWSEYGMLQGEEAFFALAAHKNGTVFHQPWSGHITSNVTQPLSRLIFQALQYRTKYAHVQQYSGEQQAVSMSSSILEEEIDDSPFVFVAEGSSSPDAPVAPAASAIDASSGQYHQAPVNYEVEPPQRSTEKEWWELTGSIPLSEIRDGMAANGQAAASGAASAFDGMVHTSNSGPIAQPEEQDVRTDLPSWLTDQPTSSSVPVARTTSVLNNSGKLSAMSVTPPPPKGTARSSPEWQSQHFLDPAEQVLSPQMEDAQNLLSTDPGVFRPDSLERLNRTRETRNLQSLSPTTRGNASVERIQEKSPVSGTSTTGLHRVTRRNYNYSALVSALQTVGYSVPGFIATAIVSMEGQPITQVAVDDLDISKVCKQCSTIVRDVWQSLEQEQWGTYEHMEITSSDRYMLMRMVSSERRIFQVVITTREGDPGRCLEVLANVEGAINAALG